MEIYSRLQEIYYRQRREGGLARKLEYFVQEEIKRMIQVMQILIGLELKGNSSNNYVHYDEKI